MQVESSVDLRKNALLLCAFPIIDRLADPGGTRGSTTYRWKGFSAEVQERLAKDSAALLAQTGVRPGLATIMVGDDPASHLYVKNKQKACDAAGIYIDDHKLPASTTQSDLLALIEKKNADSKIHGILVQVRCPSTLTARSFWMPCHLTRMRTGFIPTISVGWWKDIPSLKPALRKGSSK